MSSEKTSDIIAALDLGSNSFHLIVARKNETGYRVIDKHKETVRLASGFDTRGNLKPQVLEKAVNSLERLGERVRKIPSRNLRIVGTNSLRKAKNANVLIEVAENILGHSVDVIAGAEEARLIFSGVTRDLNLGNTKYLVIDIGGGSTEIIAGLNEKPQRLNSLHMGCISVTLEHFPKGTLSSNAFDAAYTSVAQELEPITLSYKEHGWDEVIGSSGTVLAIRDILVKNDWEKDGISKESLNYLTDYLISVGSTKGLERSNSIFEAINQNDILLHHPFESFSPIVDFLRQAARDPKVVAIKQTLYRTGSNSPVVNALIEAAQKGKEVTVVIELQARFDEQENIELASRLQDSGAIVVYGVVGHKTHAKMILVIRREGRGLRRYVHIGTGNYHPVTSNLYTDFGLLTKSATIGNDVQRMFQQITSPGMELKLNKLLQAPFTLHTRIISLINREIKNSKAGQPARIIAKMNALTEKKIVDRLYAASQAGVKIELIIRGACTLKPGIKGISENITVRSIIGRFLEHTRIYYFENNGNPRTYLSSADWMDRNCFSRVEIAVPIEDKNLNKRLVSEGLKYYLSDKANTWVLKSNGEYHKIVTGAKKVFEVQKRLLGKLSDL